MYMTQSLKLNALARSLTLQVAKVAVKILQKSCSKKKLFPSSSSLVASRLLHTKSNIYRVKRFTCHFIVVLAEETLYSHASI